MFQSLLNALIVGIGKYTLLFAVQQMVGLGNIVLVRGGSMDTVVYLGIYSEVAKEVVYELIHGYAISLELHSTKPTFLFLRLLVVVVAGVDFPVAAEVAGGDSGVGLQVFARLQCKVEFTRYPGGEFVAL